AAQAKLLRVLVDGQVLRVGATKARTVDVRVLVATHRDLQQRVRAGSFREDLYYRLAVVPIHIPPLRQRRDDIPGICELLSRQVAAELGMRVRTITYQTIDHLKNYSFPGNIRELKNLIERAYILSSGDELGPESFPVQASETQTVAETRDGNGKSALPAPPSHLPPSFDLSAFLDSTEKELIVRTLATT